MDISIVLETKSGRFNASEKAISEKTGDQVSTYPLILCGRIFRSNQIFGYF